MCVYFDIWVGELTLINTVQSRKKKKIIKLRASFVMRVLRNY